MRSRTKLQRIREERGYTQVTLAAKAGLQPNAISNIENRRWAASESQRERLAKALNMSQEDLFDDLQQRVQFKENAR